MSVYTAYDLRKFADYLPTQTFKCAGNGREYNINDMLRAGADAMDRAAEIESEVELHKEDSQTIIDGLTDNLRAVLHLQQDEVLLSVDRATGRVRIKKSNGAEVTCSPASDFEMELAAENASLLNEIAA